MIEVTIYEGNDGWRWRAQSGNGEILASGEAYENRGDCEHAVDLLFSPREPVACIVDLGDVEIDGKTERRQKFQNLR